MSDTLDAAPSSAVVAESEVTSSTTSAQDDATADTTTTDTGIPLGEDFMNKIFIMLGGQKQWRPVFADMFRQGIKPRRRAGFLRHLLVESGITYSGLCDAYKVS